MKLIIILIFSASTFLVSAQKSPEQEVKQSIVQLFDAMQKGDTVAARNLFHSTARLQSISKKSNGKVALENDAVDEFIKQIGSLPKNLKIEERILSYEIRVDSIMATAWTPYEFYVNEKISHCGVNAFQLINETGSWKIVQIIDTRRKDCK